MTPVTTSSTFKISSNAVFETFEDEVIVINMVSGSYFAMDAVALKIWTLLQSQAPLQSIVEAMQEYYQGDPAAIESAVKTLVDELEQEGLILRFEENSVGHSPDSATRPRLPKSADGAERPVFQAPVLNKFTDMEELLLLDPIHEVDEMGWPHAKAAPPQAPSSETSGAHPS